MPTRRIADLPAPEVCKHREHDAPKHMVFQPGEYEHECPACGAKYRFTVGATHWVLKHPAPPARFGPTSTRDRYVGPYGYGTPPPWQE